MGLCNSMKNLCELSNIFILLKINTLSNYFINNINLTLRH
jgi:hypothetical protein